MSWVGQVASMRTIRRNTYKILVRKTNEINNVGDVRSIDERIILKTTVKILYVKTRRIRGKLKESK
jgi:hypothetical protein